jgi:acyl-CoA dehydrogenase
MLFEIPTDITNYLAVLDDFIEREIKPIEARDDNIRFFDHRREDARTDWEREGLPNEEWWALLGEMRDVADKAGHYRYAIPEEFGGRNGSNLSMAVIRHHLAHKGLGLHNDLQNESSIVGNLVQVLMLRDFGTDSQKCDFIPPMLEGKMAWSFGLTEAAHGSDATHMETRAVPEMRDGVAGYRIDGEKMWITGVHKTSHVMTFARTNGEDGKARGITCFVVPVDTPGFDIGQYMWTFNMPTDHAKIACNNVWVPESAILGELDNGLAVAQHFVHENRIRQAASSLGAAQYCIDEAVKYARERKPFGKALATNQGIQFPLVELQTDAEMLRLLIYKTAAEMDTMTKPEVAIRLSNKVSMCNYKANRLCCNAADFAMQVHGGMGYSRHKPFEHIYRHHRRYRITEGAEEIQMRKVAGHLFGFMG